jgi:hypothetical protein
MERVEKDRLGLVVELIEFQAGANEGSALVVGRRVGFIDMPNFARFGMEDLPINLELPGDLLQLQFLVDGHSGCG